MAHKVPCRLAPLLFLFLFFPIQLPFHPSGLAPQVPAEEVLGQGSGVVSIAPLPEGTALGETQIYFENGAVYVLGQVTNQGPNAQSLVKVVAEFLDQQGQVMGEESVYINHLNPGEQKPFRMVAMEREPVAGVYLWVVEGLPAQQHRWPVEVIDLNIEAGEGGYLQIGGIVYNNDTTHLDFLKVSLVLLGKEGELLDTTAVFLTDLEPRSKQEFSTLLPQRAGWVRAEISFD